MPTNVRVTVTFAETIGDGAPNVRINSVVAESVSAGYPNVRISLAYVESVAAGFPNVRTNLAFTETVAAGYPNVRIPLIFIETICDNPVEPALVTLTLPGFGNAIGTPSIPAALDPASRLPGLTFSVHKKPQFVTRVNESVSLNSIRSQMTDFARWNFELPFEFLEDSSGANSSLKQLMGTFLATGGRALPFLFKDSDDYLVTGGTLATADGVTTQYDFMRAIGPYSEPVGQVDTANTINLYALIAENGTVPSSGPYTVTVAHAAAFTEDHGVTIGGTPLTKVSGSPGAMQYSVAAGVYTFNSAQHGAAAIISYRYLIAPAAYTVTLPNKVVFGSAPASGAILTADFQFFFTCYFDEDIQDFEKFANKLWALQSLKFHSELLA